MVLATLYGVVLPTLDVLELLLQAQHYIDVGLFVGLFHYSQGLDKDKFPLGKEH
jgi:hypothetical protein